MLFTQKIIANNRIINAKYGFTNNKYRNYRLKAV